MPVINPQRQGLNLPSVQAQAPDANFMVGVARPNTDAANSALAKGAALQNFLQGFTGGFTQQIQENGAKAALQGAMDAQGQQNAIASKDEHVQKQSLLMQEFYQNGYVSAAASDQLAKYRVDSLKRVKDAALNGLSDDEFAQQEQKANAEFQSKMAQYLPDMPKQAALSALSTLQQTSAANYKEFQTQRAKQAQITADRALDTNLSSSSQEFQQRLQTGSLEDAESSLKSGMDAILAAQHLTKDKKLDRVKQYLTSVAQNQTDPLVIDGLQQFASKELGINSVDVNKALFAEFKRAGSQMEGQVLFALDDLEQSLDGQSPDQRQATLAEGKQRLQTASQLGIVSPGTAVAAWDKLKKQEAKAQAQYAFDDALSTGKTVATYAASAGIDMDKARNEVLKHFQDTAKGNIDLLNYGKRSKDNWAIDKAQERMGKQMATTVSTMDQLGEDGQVSQENQATIATFTQMYSTSTDVGKMALAQQIPEEWRGIVQRAIVQSPNNASNIILDDLRRLAQNKASGRYDSIKANPSDKMLDSSGEANWFSFGSTADAQRTEARAAMEAEYKYMYRKNPEALVGKSAEDINTMLKGNIQSRKLEIEVGGKPRFVYLPAGSSMKDYMGSYQGSTEQFTNALQDTVNTAVQNVIDPSNLERVIIQAGTAGSAGTGMTATVFSKDGTFQNVSINTGNVASLAQSRYNEELAGQVKEGEKSAGIRPVSFYDHDNGRTVQMNVSGVNSVGMKPALFSDVSTKLMEFEGFRQNKGNGSVGFGLHDNSGLPVPQQVTAKEAVGMLKVSLEKQYVPNVKGIMKQYGIPASDEATRLLVDLNYHGGNGSTSPVAEAMQQYRETVKNPLESGNAILGSTGAEAAVWLALKQQPAYKQAQPSRKKYLEENLRDWMYSQHVQ